MQPKNPELHATGVLGPAFSMYTEREERGRPRWLVHHPSINLINQ